MAGRAVSLSRLVTEGAEGAKVTFGQPLATAAGGTLLHAGRAHFRSQAQAGAVGAILTNDRPSVELILGAVAAGATLVSLPPPRQTSDGPEYAALVRQALEMHELDGIVARDDLADRLEALGVPAYRHVGLGARPLAAPNGDGFRLVQFSSGSTTRPKAILLDDAKLGFNVQGIVAKVNAGADGQVAVSWLPLSHDMGLIGALFAALAAGQDIVLLDPMRFLRRPGEWIAALSEQPAAWTAVPDFGLRLAARRGSAASVDLGRLECAIVGGEIVRADTLAQFSSVYGVRPGVLCPSYGLAEIGLAATMTPRGTRWRQDLFSTVALADGTLRTPSKGEPATTLVASGTALPGYEISTDTGPDQVGIIKVRGPSIGARSGGESLANAQGWLDTGDLGFVRDGWLHVCGRTDDYLPVRGLNLYAPAVEAAVSDVPGVRHGRAAAVALHTGEWVVLAEPAGGRPDPSQVAQIQDDIRVAAVRAVQAQPDRIHLVKRGTLPFTTSGKLQRHGVRAQLLRGTMPILESQPEATE